MAGDVAETEFRVLYFVRTDEHVSEHVSEFDGAEVGVRDDAGEERIEPDEGEEEALQLRGLPIKQLTCHSAPGAMSVAGRREPSSQTHRLRRERRPGSHHGLLTPS